MAIDTVDKLVIPKPAYHVLRRLTGEARPDIALSLALKDLIRLRLEAARTAIDTFEKKYGMAFAAFQEQWQAGQIPAAHSYPVEQDYLEWEAAHTDIQALEELAQSIL